MLFNFGKKKETPLPKSGELPLGDYFWGLHGPEEVVYLAEKRSFRRKVHISGPMGSAWGFSTEPVPVRVRTVEALLEYLVKTHDYSLEDAPKQFRGNLAEPETLPEADDTQTLSRLLEQAHVALVGKDQITVGREKGSDLTFSDKEWSRYPARRQAMFVRERGRWHLMDLNATNKTYLNGEALKPYILEPLAPGDEIRFANQDPICFDL